MAQPTNTRFAVAVHLLTLLAGSPGAWLDSQSLAGSPATNAAHVRRILGRLRSAGLVRSQPGPHGGWTLEREPGAIDLSLVWLAVNGEDPVLGVHVPQPDCPVGRRVHRNLLALDRRALDALLTDLRRTTVADMLEAEADRDADAEPARAG
ncbi:Rrf2 family transcriptional regulator [Phaeacidiphilus oryzae]|uniref:Rrf2 family transcriptional regulator n=1 Tax=Phaeacidiphilus oryzae TaxID=348818 RepID=UPI000569C763|nr:Rrf2 family transcriptional regulator [Phaeacidiphilus oryzae]